MSPPGKVREFVTISLDTYERIAGLLKTTRSVAALDSRGASTSNSGVYDTDGIASRIWLSAAVITSNILVEEN